MIACMCICSEWCGELQVQSVCKRRGTSQSQGKECLSSILNFSKMSPFFLSSRACLVFGSIWLQYSKPSKRSRASQDWKNTFCCPRFLLVSQNSWEDSLKIHCQIQPKSFYAFEFDVGFMHETAQIMGGMACQNGNSKNELNSDTKIASIQKKLMTTRPLW